MSTRVGISATGSHQRNVKICLMGQQKRLEVELGKIQSLNESKKHSPRGWKTESLRIFLHWSLLEKTQGSFLICKPSCDLNTSFSNTTDVWESGMSFPLKSLHWLYCFANEIIYRHKHREQQMYGYQGGKRGGVEGNERSELIYIYTTDTMVKIDN